jgi:signal transduction histidine kinase
MNLLYNAYQALDCNGYICVNTSKDEDFVKIAIKDTGKGIDPEIIDSIFNPFYTTRPDGTGLGLALVYSVVAKHWGHIEVDSKPGKGSIFTIRLPFREKVKILD